MTSGMGSFSSRLHYLPDQKIQLTLTCILGGQAESEWSRDCATKNSVAVGLVPGRRPSLSCRARDGTVVRDTFTARAVRFCTRCTMTKRQDSTKPFSEPHLLYSRGRGLERGVMPRCQKCFFGRLPTCCSA